MEGSSQRFSLGPLFCRLLLFIFTFGKTAIDFLLDSLFSFFSLAFFLFVLELHLLEVFEDGGKFAQILSQGRVFKSEFVNFFALLI